ncbi:unnamed protein product, partial [Nesidiocoris tenuis]
PTEGQDVFCNLFKFMLSVRKNSNALTSKKKFSRIRNGWPTCTFQQTSRELLPRTRNILKREILPTIGITQTTYSHHAYRTEGPLQLPEGPSPNGCIVIILKSRIETELLKKNFFSYTFTQNHFLNKYTYTPVGAGSRIFSFRTQIQLLLEQKRPGNSFTIDPASGNCSSTRSDTE